VILIEGIRTTMEGPSAKQMRYRYVFAVTGVLVGLCVGVVFSVVFHNPDAATWGLVSGIYIYRTVMYSGQARTRAPIHEEKLLCS